jgi:hypothetical protein
MVIYSLLATVRQSLVEDPTANLKFLVGLFSGLTNPVTFSALARGDLRAQTTFLLWGLFVHNQALLLQSNTQIRCTTAPNNKAPARKQRIVSICNKGGCVAHS